MQNPDDNEEEQESARKEDPSPGSDDSSQPTTSSAHAPPLRAVPEVFVVKPPMHRTPLTSTQYHKMMAQLKIRSMFKEKMQAVYAMGKKKDAAGAISILIHGVGNRKKPGETRNERDEEMGTDGNEEKNEDMKNTIDQVFNSAGDRFEERMTVGNEETKNFDLLEDQVPVEPENEDDEAEEMDTEPSKEIDRLVAPLPNGASIDTKALVAQITDELKMHNISQVAFAENVICRRQGTLSDLLRNPKSWENVSKGRETYLRMYNWLRMPLVERLMIIGPTAASRRRSRPLNPTTISTPPVKRMRFTQDQKKTLNALFQENPRPSLKIMGEIGDQMGFEVSTIVNFFQNARRRSYIVQID